MIISRNQEKNKDDLQSRNILSVGVSMQKVGVGVRVGVSMQKVGVGVRVGVSMQKVTCLTYEILFAGCGTGYWLNQN